MRASPLSRGIYQYNYNDLQRFVGEYGFEVTHKGNEVIFKKCPYCHGGDKHDKNTFAVNSTTGIYNCKRSSCNARGNMFTLARDFNFKLSEDVQRYYNIDNYNGKFKKFREKHIESKDEAVKYLKERGISEEICRKYEISVKNENPNILCFPFRDDKGIMKFIKYRDMAYQKGVSAGNKEWCEKDCMPILFGMNHCNSRKTLVITEGQIDSLTLAECGIENAVSVPTGMNGFTWIPHCWDFVNSFEEIVVFGDFENGKVTLSDTISARFPKRTRIVQEVDYNGFKDANEIYLNLGKEAIIAAVEHSEPCLNKRVKPLHTVRWVDINKIPVIHTNIAEIDRILSGGFHFGQVILLTGQRGNGKSTLSSGFLADALKQEFNCFMYSGEMPDFFVKDWLNRQIIGKEFLTEEENNACDNWYYNRVFIYDNNILDEDGDTESVIDVMEDTIKKKDCKLCVLDNLMTLTDATSNDTLYRQQSNIVGRLAKISKAYECVIVLVAHPRKSNGLQFSNDDVSGSADITNRVDIVMSYDRPQEGQDNERALQITKNRLTGKLATGDRAIKLFFEDSSKRIVGENESFNKEYIVNDDGSVYVSEEDIPF